MTINDFKEGDIVVITDVSQFLNKNIGLICEVVRFEKGKLYLNRHDAPHNKCVFNSTFARYVKLRPATDREKFLYYTHGIEKVEP